MKEFIKSKKGNLIVSVSLLVIAVVVTVIVGINFKSFSDYKVYFYESEAVTSKEKLSDYSKNLKGTVGDSDIYVLDSGVEGPSLLILGGTHPNEPSGQLTSVFFLENLKVHKGKVYIITEANRSAYTHSHPQEASPYYYSIKTASGKERIFKFGSRATNTNQQWPNPDIYVHSSGQKLTSNDTRNLNRSYPGNENGTYSEKVAYGITQLIRENDITMTIDLHEASPEYITINALVYHQRASELAGRFALEMEFCDVKISTEVSPLTLHGLTHRELGDHTNTLAFLCETSNASQGKLRGAFTEELITDGTVDKFYQKALELEQRENNDKLIYGAPTTIDERVARHAISILSIINSYNSMSKYTDSSEYSTAIGKLEIELAGLKFYSETEEPISAAKLRSNSRSIYDNIMENHLGIYLHDPE